MSPSPERRIYDHVIPPSEERPLSNTGYTAVRKRNLDVSMISRDPAEANMILSLICDSINDMLKQLNVDADVLYSNIPDSKNNPLGNIGSIGVFKRASEREREAR